MLRLIESLKFYQDGHQPLYRISVIVLFWALADGIASYVLPVYLQQVLKDLFLVGLIFASSSAFGLLADFYFGSEQTGRTFKPYFIGSIFLAIIVYLITLKANSWPVFLLVMALWGFYYDGLNFGLVDFLSRFSQKWEHAQSAGVVNMFFSLGYLLAPIVCGYAVLKGRAAMGSAIFFMFLALASFFLWFKGKKILPQPPIRKLSFFQELKIWLKVGKKSFWVLVGGLLINTWDSLIWGMGPILLVSSLGVKGAYVMASFMIPRVFLQGYIGRLADKKDKKQFLVLGIILAGIFLSLFSLSNNLTYKILMALASAVGVAIFWPAADGLYIDMIDGYRQQREEIAGIRGFSYDLAYVVGPLIAGLAGSIIGLPATFFIFGLFLVSGAVLIKILWQ